MKVQVRPFNLAVLLICLGSFSFKSVYAAEAPIVVGAIVSVKDMATIASAGPKGAKRSAKPGDTLFLNDQITTSKDGAVKLLLKDHSVVDLGASSVFKVDQYAQNHGADRQVQASMEQGTVRGAVTEKITGNGKFHLKTPSATMGVRGTEFVVDAPPPSQPGGTPPPAKFTVLQGQVEVSHSSAALGAGIPSGGGGGAGNANASKVSLSAGQQVTAEANAPLPSKAVTLDSASLSKVSSSAKVADNTFSHAVVIDNSSSSNSGNSSSNSSQSSTAPAGGSRGPSSTGSNGDSGSNSGGSSTMAEISTAVAAPSAALVPKLSIADIGISGTFGAANALHPITVQQNGLSHLTVRIH